MYIIKQGITLGKWSANLTNRLKLFILVLGWKVPSRQKPDFELLKDKGMFLVRYYIRNKET